MSLARSILKKVTSVAVGCTEPSAIGLATAIASQAAGGEVCRIEIHIDQYTYKNAMWVTVPNTGGMTGISIAATLGSLYGDPELELEIFRKITQEQAARAIKMVSESNVQVDILSNKLPVYIDATVITSTATGRAVIKGSHTNLVLVEVDGKKVMRDKAKVMKYEGYASWEFTSMGIPQLLNLAAQLDPSDISFLLEGSEMNMAIAEYGLSERSGLAVGARLLGSAQSEMSLSNVAQEAQALTAAAVDARMSGCNLPVMANAGSGNQGLGTTLPITVTARSIGTAKLELAKALAIGHLFAAFIRLKLGELSTICGSSIAASIGACAGIFWVMNKDEELISKAVNSIIASIAGIFCNGANGSCALKMAVASRVAVETVHLTMQGLEIPAETGIIDRRAELSLTNLGLIARSMKKTEHTILDIMMNKVP
jgi:L-cysteine desulfidase